MGQTAGFAAGSWIVRQSPHMFRMLAILVLCSLIIGCTVKPRVKGSSQGSSKSSHGNVMFSAPF